LGPTAIAPDEPSRIARKRVARATEKRLTNQLAADFTKEHPKGKLISTTYTHLKVIITCAIT
jgi:hypothetical protein